ncbi:hypothetical protein [Luteimonas sp. SDU82]|uniref:hypothetical protein n=1 Tax=Luteimonas sp. SDU82 TaxID=3422592 RepID=UPI003EB91773
MRRSRRLSWIASPFLVWGLHFFAVYVLQGLACGRGWPPVAAWTGIGLATLAAFAAVIGIGLHARRQMVAAGTTDERRFTARLVAMLSLLAIVAMLFTCLPVLLLQPCE